MSVMVKLSCPIHPKYKGKRMPNFDRIFYAACVCDLMWRVLQIARHNKAGGFARMWDVP